MARVLLDSTVLIDMLRGRSAVDRVRAMRRQGDDAWFCVISVEEIWRGLRDGEESGARSLFRGLRLAPLGVEEGAQAGVWRRQYSARGIVLHQADCLIAAAAARVGGRLATGNPSDFPTSELPVEFWPAGE